jgi:hypothetical protein
MSQESSRKGKSRDTRDRLTFDVGELRDRLRAQAIEPLSIAGIDRPHGPDRMASAAGSRQR